MATITIPKEIVRKGDLVIIPRQEYEEFLEFKRAIPFFKPTASDKRALTEARKNKKKGNLLTFNELKSKLGITN